MLFTLGVVCVFALGGLTGLYLATISTDLYLHDTMFVVGHFHLIMAAATFLAIFAAIHFWFPKMFGRLLDERLGKCALLALAHLHHPAVSAGSWSRATPGSPAGCGIPHQYGFLKHLAPLNRWTSYFAFALGASQLLFVVNFFANVFRKPNAEANPWKVGHPGVDGPLPAPAAQLRSHPHRGARPPRAVQPRGARRPWGATGSPRPRPCPSRPPGAAERRPGREARR